MNRCTHVIAIGVLALVATQASSLAEPVTGVPAAGSASPVTINNCGPKLSGGSQTQVAGIQLAQSSAGIRIEFTNESTKVADLVNFSVDSAGQQFIIRDVGTFSPGVSIKHEYRNGAGQSFVLPAFIAPKVTCKVASVKFTDGTVWPQSAQAPSAGAPASRAVLTADPTRLDIDRATDSELLFVKSTERVSGFRETDTCSGIASVFVAATGQSSATYSVKPLLAGTCSATITDEAGNTLSIPITVR
jgi:hypothetical protein